MKLIKIHNDYIICTNDKPEVGEFACIFSEGINDIGRGWSISQIGFSNVSKLQLLCDNTFKIIKCTKFLSNSIELLDYDIIHQMYEKNQKQKLYTKDNLIDIALQCINGNIKHNYQINQYIHDIKNDIVDITEIDDKIIIDQLNTNWLNNEILYDNFIKYYLQLPLLEKLELLYITIECEKQQKREAKLLMLLTKIYDFYTDVNELKTLLIIAAGFKNNENVKEHYENVKEHFNEQMSKK